MIAVGIFIALLLMFFGEQMENDTKKEYIDKGYDWNKVLLYSNFTGLISGILSTLVVISSKTPIVLNTYFMIFATTITAYITTQSVMTDFKILLINRNILRVSYLSIYVVSIINIATSDIYKYNWSGLLMFTGLLVFIFIFSSIGASDVRLLATGIPYAISIGGYTAIVLLIITLILVAIGMYIKRGIYILKELPNYAKRYPDMVKDLGKVKFNIISAKTISMELNTNEDHAVPVGPFMIMPFLVYLIAYPFF